MRRKLSPQGFCIFLVCSLAVFLLPLFLFQRPPHANNTVTARENPQVFIETIAPHAQELSRAYGIKASLLIGQAALASNYGSNRLAVKYHNLYGVTSNKTAHTVRLMRSVYRQNKWTSVAENYVVYASWQEGMDAYLVALKTGQWGEQLYDNLATHPSNDEAAQFLAASSYTTDPDYTNKLTAIISQYQLTRYD